MCLELVQAWKDANILGLNSISAIDYSVILVRDMRLMRNFYENILGFSVFRVLSENWVEYKLGSNTLALSSPGLTAEDAPVPAGTASLQLAFRVPVSEVDRCAEELVSKGVTLVSLPKNQSFGHRTVFFRDPDGNLLEIYAEI